MNDFRRKLEREAKDSGIGWYKNVVNSIIFGKIKDKDIVYVAGTPFHNYGGFQKRTTRAYIWDEDLKKFNLLFLNLSPHRAKIAIKNYKLYQKGLINESVWGNYITGGRSTKAGLFRTKTSKEKLNLIAQSHADYLGQETGDSTTDHYNRVRLRKKWI